MSDLSKRLPPLGTLIVFDAAIRLHSFSKAADECALSQASVSRQIRQLEENIGVSLFERRRHDVIPTNAGEKFGQTVQQTLLELASSASELRSSAAGQNSFTIFSDISIASSIVTPLLSQLQKKYPDVKFHLVSTYEPIEQTSALFDIGFQVGTSESDLFNVESIADDLVYPVCSPGIVETHGTDITPAYLATLPLLHLVVEGNKDWPDWRRFLATYRNREPLPLEGLVFSSYQILLDAAERGEGIALGWERSVHERIAEGKLVRLPGMSIHQPNGVCAYTRKNGQHHRITRSVLDTIQSSLETLGQTQSS